VAESISVFTRHAGSAVHRIPKEFQAPRITCIWSTAFGSPRGGSAGIVSGRFDLAHGEPILGDALPGELRIGEDAARRDNRHLSGHLDTGPLLECNTSFIV
jgi:hypothetical protein